MSPTQTSPSQWVCQVKKEVSSIGEQQFGITVVRTVSSRSSAGDYETRVLTHLGWRADMPTPQSPQRTHCTSSTMLLMSPRSFMAPNRPTRVISERSASNRTHLPITRPKRPKTSTSSLSLVCRSSSSPSDMALVTQDSRWAWRISWAAFERAP